MKQLILKLSSIIAITFFVYANNYAQDSLSYELTYEVNRSNPNITITRTQLKDAVSLKDLNKHFKSNRSRKYVSVEIITSYDGKLIKSKSIDDTINDDQKNAMDVADYGRAISVIYNYIPDNTLSNNTVRSDNFSFYVLPDKEAQYPEGVAKMKSYIDKAAFNKISHSDIDIYNLAAVKFTVDEQGTIVNAHVVASSKDEEVDALLLEAICNMPSWVPAEYASGLKTSQDFVFTVGDHSSCTINTLDINRFNFKD